VYLLESPDGRFFSHVSHVGGLVLVDEPDPALGYLSQAECAHVKRCHYRLATFSVRQMQETDA
jgi:hypothetical protein